MRSSIFLIILVSPVASFLSSTPVSKLLQDHAKSIEQLKQVVREKVDSSKLSEYPYNNDVFFLRFCLDCPDDARVAALESTLQWRSTDGRALCEAASQAVQQATADAGLKWNNDPVLQAAPYSDKVSKYITPSNVITTTTNKGDLVYCIRAGMIDDTALMNEVSVEQLSEFFLYTKEVNAAVANKRSLDSDKLVSVLTANDLSGVKLVGGSPEFRQALSTSSKKAASVYPATAGPTLLLNLPRLLNALVKLFTPLFPPAVTQRLKFEQGLLKDVKDLRDIAPGGSSRAAFLRELDAIVYDSK